MRYIGGSNTAVVTDGENLIDLKNVGRGQMLGTQIPGIVGYFGQNITENITVTGTQNAISVGPITLGTGNTITIQDGARYVIV